MIYQLHAKRIYDSKNRLIYELHNNTEETIFKYDDKGNLIYGKNWDLRTKCIGYEYSQEFDSNGNLIHSVNIQYGFDDVYEYTPNSNIVKNISSDSEGTIIQYLKKDDIRISKVEKITASETVDPLGHKSLYEYDDHGNVSKITDLNEDGTPGLEIYYTNIYE